MSLAIGSMLSGASTTESKDSKTKKANDNLADSFGEWMKMSPAEHIRAQYLEEHDLTESDLASMDPEKLKAIEDDISKRVQEQLGMANANKSQTDNATQTQAATSNLQDMLFKMAAS